MAAIRPTRYLSELVDVSVANPASGYILAWSAANSRWEAVAGTTIPVPVASGGTGTATPGLVAGSNIAITGTWPNQTIAAAGMAIGVAVGSGVTGGLLYVGGSGNLAEDADNLYYDSTAGQLNARLYSGGPIRAFVGTEASIANLWHFNDGTGTTVADSVGSMPLTLASASWDTSAPLLGTAAAKAYAMAPGLMPTNASWTIMGWWYTGTLADQSAVMSIGNLPDDLAPYMLVNILFSGGNYLLRIYSNNGYGNNYLAVTPNTWIHIAVSYNSASQTFRLYVNGRFVASRVAGAGNSTNGYIGSGHVSPPTGFKLDEWAKFSAVLSDAAIARHSRQAMTAAGHAYAVSLGVGTGTTTYVLDGSSILIGSPLTVSFDSSIASAVFGVGASDVLTINGSLSSSSRKGPLIVKATAAATTGAGITFDASAAGAGVAWTAFATGSGAGPGAGCFGLLNATSNVYEWLVFTNGHTNFGRSYLTDLARVTIAPEANNVTALAIGNPITAHTVPLVAFVGRSSTTDAQAMGSLDATWSTNTHASRAADIVIRTAGYNGANEAIRFRDAATFTQPIIPIANVRDAADDAAAAALSPAVPVGGLYRTGSSLKIRVS